MKPKKKSVYWILDQRFDFLLDSFEKEYGIKKEDICFVRSYFGNKKPGKKDIQIGNTEPDEIWYLESEDINNELTKTDRFKNEIQDDTNILLVPFSGVNLPSGVNIDSIISTGSVAEQFNSKYKQYIFFNDIGVKTPKTWMVESTEGLRTRVKELLSQYDKLVIKKDGLSGGYMMKCVSSDFDVMEYIKSISGDNTDALKSADEKQVSNIGYEQVGKRDEYLISEYVEHEQSFAGMAVISEDGKVIWIGVTEQVLYDDFAYEGLIWPPFADPKTTKEIRRITMEVGEGLRAEGYFGFYNVDFIKADDGIYAVEINARFGFGTILYGLYCLRYGHNFWKAVRGECNIELGSDTDDDVTGDRVIIGKIKGRRNLEYSGLKNEGDITSWFNNTEENNKKKNFHTYYAGIGKDKKTFKYGSFLGLFGSKLEISASRGAVLKQFWDSCLGHFGDRKTLISMYVGDFCGIEDTTFNFNLNTRYFISKDYSDVNGDVETDKCIKKLSEENDHVMIPDDFWGKSIASITVMIGSNGSGKSTIMRLMIQWLCQLASGIVPQEPGGFILREGATDYIIFFKGGKLGKINIPNETYPQEDQSLRDNIEPRQGRQSKERIKLQILQDEKFIMDLLDDIELIYYTDTMTDLELEDKLSRAELAFLRDESLVKRISKASAASPYYYSAKDEIKRKEFIRHMDMYLRTRGDRGWNENHSFPLRYMRLSVSKLGDSKTESYLEELLKNVDRSGIVGVIKDLCEALFQAETREPKTDIELLKQRLIWSAIIDMISGALMLIGPCGYDAVMSLINEIMDSIVYTVRNISRLPYKDRLDPLNDMINKLIEHINNMSTESSEQADVGDNHLDEVDYLNLKEKAKRESVHILRDFKNYLKVLWEVNTDDLKGVGFDYVAQESDETEAVYILSLDRMEKNAASMGWNNFFDKYKTISSFLPDCSFKWHYGSSGEFNRGAFYDILSMGERLARHKYNVWLLLDEIDNAYHPEWKRRAIAELVEACGNERNKYLSFQIWLSTHSPIMLSDSPKQGGIFMKKDGEKKKQETSVNHNTFGQQIYQIFNDAFFMERGVIGMHADKKLTKYCNELRKIEKALKSKRRISDEKIDEYKRYLKQNKYLLNLVDEPFLNGYLIRAEVNCRKLLAIREGESK